MSDRREYEMSEADLSALLEACKPVPLIALNAGMPRSSQENANEAWRALGERMGFQPMTVKPVTGKSARFFTAMPALSGSKPAGQEEGK